MLKESVTYTDFDDVKQTETLWFNLSRATLVKNIELLDRVKELAEQFEGQSRELTTAEKKSMVDLVVTFMRLSYGVRTQGGKGFRQTDEVWQEFVETAAYDEFLISLFQDTNKLYSFLTNVMPKELREQAEAELQRQQAGQSVEIPAAVEAAPSEDTRPAWIREDREPTKAEIQSMTPEQLREAFARKASV